MIRPLQPLYRAKHADPNVLSALRELFSRHPEAIAFEAETLTKLLYELRIARRPVVFEVEAALEALRVEGEVLP